MTMCCGGGLGTATLDPARLTSPSRAGAARTGRAAPRGHGSDPQNVASACSMSACARFIASAGDVRPARASLTLR